MPRSRFNRRFELSVLIGNREVSIGPPMRLVFSADKSIEGGLNTCTIRVYNLSPSNREALTKDVAQQKSIPLQLRVGYEATMHTVFKGSVYRGSSFREGPDLITELEGKDGYYDHRYSFTSRTVTNKKQALNGILQDMPNTTEGKITAQTEIQRPKVLVGRSTRLIDEILGAGETWYIEDEKLYVLKDDEVVGSFRPVVSAESGLLSTPTREFSLVTFETLMNPSLKIGGLCELQTVTAPHLNGVYKIWSMSHSGDTHGADWKQKCTCRRLSDPTVV